MIDNGCKIIILRKNCFFINRTNCGFQVLKEGGPKIFFSYILRMCVEILDASSTGDPDLITWETGVEYISG